MINVGTIIGLYDASGEHLLAGRALPARFSKRAHVARGLALGLASRCLGYENPVHATCWSPRAAQS